MFSFSEYPGSSSPSMAVAKDSTENDAEWRRVAIVSKKKGAKKNDSVTSAAGGLWELANCQQWRSTGCRTRVYSLVYWLCKLENYLHWRWRSSPTEPYPNIYNLGPICR